MSSTTQIEPEPRLPERHMTAFQKAMSKMFERQGDYIDEAVVKSFKQYKKEVDYKANYRKFPIFT